MLKDQVSLTSIMTTYMRAHHSINDTPKIFDDFLAYDFIPEERRLLIEQGLAMAIKPNGAKVNMATALPSLLQTMGLPNVIGRAIYSETELDQAIQQGITQYVMLGAGMDSFAFRRPELLKKLEIFEIDHPATQAFKQNRITELNWKIPSNLHFIPADFAKQNLSEALNESTYNPHIKSFFSWLGVTMYLTKEEIFNTLSSISELTQTGSTIIFDYFLQEDSDKHNKDILNDLKKIGEPIKSKFEPTELASLLANAGFLMKDNLLPDIIQKRFFQGKSTSYHASANVCFAHAIKK